MVSIFTNYDKPDHRRILIGPHTTSPGTGEESAIVRNSPRPIIEVRKTEIYTKARQIFTRGRRASLVRGSEIV